MDPNQAWNELADAVVEERWERAAEIAEGMLCWLHRGGCPPGITGRRAFDKIIAEQACEAIAAWEVS